MSLFNQMRGTKMCGKFKGGKEQTKERGGMTEGRKTGREEGRN